MYHGRAADRRAWPYFGRTGVHSVHVEGTKWMNWPNAFVAVIPKAGADPTSLQSGVQVAGKSVLAGVEREAAHQF